MNDERIFTSNENSDADTISDEKTVNDSATDENNLSRDENNEVKISDTEQAETSTDENESNDEQIKNTSVETDFSAPYESKENVGDSNDEKPFVTLPLKDGEFKVNVETETTGDEDTDNLEKENNPDTFDREDQKEEPVRVTLDKTAELFGVSEETLVGEFNAYKASKLFKRINWLLIDPKADGEKLKRLIDSAILLGIESVTVFPVNLELAKKHAGDKIKIRVAAFYPFGAETQKAKMKFVAKASRMKADAIELPVFLGELIKRGAQKTAKDWIKLKKKAGKTQLIAVTDFDNLSESEKGIVLTMLRRAGIEKLKTSTCVLSKGEKELAPGTEPKYFENVKTEVAMASPSAEDLLKAFREGADTVSSPDVETAVKDVKKLLGCED